MALDSINVNTTNVEVLVQPAVVTNVVVSEGTRGKKGDKGDRGYSITGAHVDENGDLILSVESGEFFNVGPLDAIGAEALALATSHSSLTNNPHSVTKAQLGLPNVDNTADADKPISTLTQAALDAKADSATTLGGYGITDAAPKSHSDSKENPHEVTKGQVGLGNVDNTSDADKPISAAQQTALNSKVDKVEGKGLSTEDYTTAEKAKLNGISEGANLYTHPENHPASIISQDANNRFVTDAEKSAWNSKQAPATTLAGYGITDASPISHITDSNNPHSVTYEQVGAAPASHATHMSPIVAAMIFGGGE